MKKTFFLIGLLATVYLLACQDNKQTNAVPEEPAAVVPTQPGPAPQPQSDFRETKTYRNISFEIIQEANSSKLEILPQGLAEANEPMVAQLRGRVGQVIVDDIDGDDSPEIGVVDNYGSNGEADIQVFSVLAKKSLVMVYLPALSADNKLLNGYRGEDAYEFVENTMVRRFPLYEGTTKTGKYRQLQYKLKPGEAMKQLIFDRSNDY